MLITPLTKIVMCLALAVFCLLVTFDSLTDYSTNYLFVQHVLDMNTTFPNNDLMYRAITNPLVWKIGYALIIAAEGGPAPCSLSAAGTFGGRGPRPAPPSIVPKPTPSPVPCLRSSSGFSASW